MYRPASTLTVNNAQAELDAGLRAIASGQTKVDLSGLTTVDSAAVATLLAWQRAASKAGKTLTFLYLPHNLLSLLELYGLRGLLHFDTQSESHHEVHPEAHKDLPRH